jgi:uncharacterized protein YceK
VVLGGCRSVLTFTFVGQLEVVVGFVLCGCASVFTLLQRKSERFIVHF